MREKDFFPVYRTALFMILRFKKYRFLFVSSQPLTLTAG